MPERLEVSRLGAIEIHVTFDTNLVMINVIGSTDLSRLLIASCIQVLDNGLALMQCGRSRRVWWDVYKQRVDGSTERQTC